jgi:hypothetical protein
MMGDLRDFNKNSQKNNDNTESNNNNTDVNTLHVEDSNSESAEMVDIDTVPTFGLDKQLELSENC